MADLVTIEAGPSGGMIGDRGQMDFFSSIYHRGDDGDRSGRDDDGPDDRASDQGKMPSELAGDLRTLSATTTTATAMMMMNCGVPDPSSPPVPSHPLLSSAAAPSGTSTKHTRLARKSHFGHFFGLPCPRRLLDRFVIRDQLACTHLAQATAVRYRTDIPISKRNAGSDHASRFSRSDGFEDRDLRDAHASS